MAVHLKVHFTIVVFAICCISFSAAVKTRDGRGCGTKYGCYEGTCWSDCNMLGLYTGWCYTTYGMPGIPSYISCLDDSHCSPCHNCGDICTATSPMPSDRQSRNAHVNWN